MELFFDILELLLELTLPDFLGPGPCVASDHFDSGLSVASRYSGSCPCVASSHLSSGACVASSHLGFGLCVASSQLSSIHVFFSASGCRYSKLLLFTA